MCSVLRIMDCYSLNRLYDRSVFFYPSVNEMKCAYILYTVVNEIPSDDSGFKTVCDVGIV